MSDNPLQSIFSSRTLVRVLSVLLFNPDRYYYQQELLRETGGPLRPLQLALEKLTAAELVSSRRDGRQIYYRANTLNPVFGDLRSLFEKSFALADVVRDALQPAAPGILFAFLYGSAASGEMHTTSDVDLLVVGNVGRRALATALGDAEATVWREINVTIYEADRFTRALQNQDPFILEVLSRPRIWLVGDEHGLATLSD